MSPRFLLDDQTGAPVRGVWLTGWWKFSGPLIALYTNPLSHHQKASKLPRRYKVTHERNATPQFKNRPNRPPQTPQTHPSDPLTRPLSPKPTPTTYQNITQNARSRITFYLLNRAKTGPTVRPPRFEPTTSSKKISLLFPLI